jgi:hypothetical protein
MKIYAYYNEDEKEFENDMKNFNKLYKDNMINYFEFGDIKRFIEFIEKKEGSYLKLYKKYFIETGIAEKLEKIDMK